MVSRILLSSYDFLPHSFGGGEMYVYRLAKELRRLGNEVAVVIRTPWLEGSSGFGSYCYDGIPVHTFSVDPSRSSHLEDHLGFGIATVDAVVSVLKEFSPDLVHINGLKAAFTKACNELGVPHVVTAHHAGIACPAGGGMRPDNSACLAPMGRGCIPCGNWWRRPCWYTGGVIGRLPSWFYRPLGKRHNGKKHLNYLERGLIYPWIVEESIAAKRMVLQHAQRLIVPSRYMAGLLERNGAPRDRIRLVPHGIEPLARTPLDEVGQRPLRFGYVGRLEPLKGIHTLLQAAELLAGTPLEIHIFGAARNARDESYFRDALTRFKGDATIVEHGVLPPERVGEAYRLIDVLVVPSQVPESFGLVVLEAFSAGRPVIAFNSGALPELVCQGVDGLVTVQNGPQALAEAMQQFLSRPSLVTEMAERTRHLYTLEGHVASLQEIYREVSEGPIKTEALAWR